MPSQFVRLVCGLLALTASATVLADGTDETVGPALPRWREGVRPYDAQQSLHPYALTVDRAVPTSGEVASPPEYDPVRGVLYTYMTGQWTTVVRDLVVKLTNDPNCPTCDEIAYVVVTSAAQQSSATSVFQTAGANMSKVRFIIEPANALWIRDYGPHFIWQDGALALVDSQYYPERMKDNYIPTLLAHDLFHVPSYDMGLYYSGGNFQPGPNHMAVMSALVTGDNPPADGFDVPFINDLFKTYQGVNTLHIFPQLPWAVDGTGHIDMWMYLVNDHTCIISEFQPGSNATAISITNNAAPYMQNLGFTVYRTPAWVAPLGGYDTNFTYTNAFRVNDRIFVPTYSSGNAAYADEDAAALATWQAAAGPGVEIVPIDCYSIINAAGAIHCIVMQVPRRTGAGPAAHVVWPDGGQILTAGGAYNIRWAATDTNNADIPRVDLYYSLDDGAHWTLIATTTNTGSYAWTAPNSAAPKARIKVVATAADLDAAEAVSATAFQIARVQETVYDFSANAGVNRFAYGSQALNWTAVAGQRKPVTTALSAANYAALAYSDATGSKTDPNRYIAPTPTPTYYSTHVFEFYVAEAPNTLDELALHWEGFADQCTQVELYVWDYVQGDWSNGALEYGQNRYLESWAGNADGTLDGRLHSNLARYIGPGGQVTLLLFAERASSKSYPMPTFHDYVAVTARRITQTLAGDANCDGAVDFRDINAFVVALNGPESYAAAYPACKFLNSDCNGDGVVDFKDINAFVSVLAGP